MLFFRLDIHEPGDEVGEHARQLDVLHSDCELGGRLWNQLQRFDRALLHLDHSRFDFGRDRIGFMRELDARDMKRIAAKKLGDAEALLTLTDEMMRAVGRRQITNDRCGGSDFVQLGGRRILRCRIALQDDADPPLAAHRFLDRGHRRFAADVDRHHQAGEQHEIARRKNDQRIVGNRRKCGLGASPRFLGRRARRGGCCLIHLHVQNLSSDQSLRSRRRKQPCSSTRSSISKRPCGRLMRRSKRPYGISSL